MADAMTDTQATPQLTVRGQYIKDLSFESPNGPFAMGQQKEAPKMEVNVDLGARKVADEMYELEIKSMVKATGQDNATIFVIELAYAGLFQLKNIPEDRLQPMLFIDCPFILFPFARRVIADVTRDGGFPPLMMEPIDFHSLFARRMQEEQARQKTAAN